MSDYPTYPEGLILQEKIWSLNHLVRLVSLVWQSAIALSSRSNKLNMGHLDLPPLRCFLYGRLALPIQPDYSLDRDGT